jgi:hypothetical protein
MHGLLLRSNSSVIMNCRTGGGKRRSGIYFGPDLNLQDDAVYPGLEDLGCEGGIVVKQGDGGGEDVVHQSNTVSLNRTHLIFEKSLDSGRTFDDGLLVWEGPSNYSMLVDAGDHVGLLLELGEKGSYETIGYAMVA